MALKAHHPGTILREGFMEAVGLTPHKLATALAVPLSRVNDSVLEKRSIWAEMGLLLTAYFGTTDQYWVNLQTAYDRRLRLTDREEAEEQRAASDGQVWIAGKRGFPRSSAR